MHYTIEISCIWAKRHTYMHLQCSPPSPPHPTKWKQEANDVQAPDQRSKSSRERATAGIPAAESPTHVLLLPRGRFMMPIPSSPSRAGCRRQLHCCPAPKPNHPYLVLTTWLSVFPNNRPVGTARCVGFVRSALVRRVDVFSIPAVALSRSPDPGLVVVSELVLRLLALQYLSLSLSQASWKVERVQESGDEADGRVKDVVDAVGHWRVGGLEARGGGEGGEGGGREEADNGHGGWSMSRYVRLRRQNGRGVTFLMSRGWYLKIKIKKVGGTHKKPLGGLYGGGARRIVDRLSQLVCSVSDD